MLAHRLDEAIEVPIERALQIARRSGRARPGQAVERRHPALGHRRRVLPRHVGRDDRPARRLGDFDERPVVGRVSRPRTLVSQELLSLCRQPGMRRRPACTSRSNISSEPSRVRAAGAAPRAPPPRADAYSDRRAARRRARRRLARGREHRLEVGERLVPRVEDALRHVRGAWLRPGWGRDRRRLLWGRNRLKRDEPDGRKNRVHGRLWHGTGRLKPATTETSGPACRRTGRLFARRALDGRSRHAVHVT